MIKGRGRVDLDKATQIIGMSKNELEGLLYDLIGDNKVSGRFEGDIFIVESDVDSFINIFYSAFMPLIKFFYKNFWNPVSFTLMIILVNRFL